MRSTQIAKEIFLQTGKNIAATALARNANEISIKMILALKSGKEKEAMKLLEQFKGYLDNEPDKYNRRIAISELKSDNHNLMQTAINERADEFCWALINAGFVSSTTNKDDLNKLLSLSLQRGKIDIYNELSKQHPEYQGYHYRLSTTTQEPRLAGTREQKSSTNSNHENEQTKLVIAAIEYAIRESNFETIDILLDCFSNVSLNTATDDGKTLLEKAALANNGKIAASLLTYGAAPQTDGLSLALMYYYNNLYTPANDVDSNKVINSLLKIIPEDNLDNHHLAELQSFNNFITATGLNDSLNQYLKTGQRMIDLITNQQNNNGPQL